MRTWKWCSRSALGMVPPEKKYLDIQSSSPFTCSEITSARCALQRQGAFPWLLSFLLH